MRIRHWKELVLGSAYILNDDERGTEEEVTYLGHLKYKSRYSCVVSPKDDPFSEKLLIVSPDQLSYIVRIQAEEKGEGR